MLLQVSETYFSYKATSCIFLLSVSGRNLQRRPIFQLQQSLGSGSGRCCCHITSYLLYQKELHAASVTTNTTYSTGDLQESLCWYSTIPDHGRSLQHSASSTAELGGLYKFPLFESTCLGHHASQEANAITY